jgi:hypothetical protein
VTILEAEQPGFEEQWSRLWESASLRHALYGPLNLRYYECLGRGRFQDRSFIVCGGDGPVVGVRVAATVDGDGQARFSCFGLPSVFVAAGTAGLRSLRAAHSTVKEHVGSLVRDHASWEWRHAEHLQGGALSGFGRHLLSLGAVPEVQTTQIIDLARPEEELFSGLSKSFRWSVNWGRKNLTIRVLDGAALERTELAAFRALHREAAQRETRSVASWDRQFDLVRGGEGFVCLGELDGALVTAALFSASPDHCFYGVSASRRGLFDKPLSHAILWRAISYARERGCRWFETGAQHFPYQVPPPTEKELSISTFKRGFGGATIVQLTIVARDSRRRE